MMKSLFNKQSEPFVYHKYYLLLQEKWAVKMNSLSAGMSRRKLICALVLFTLLCSGYLIYILYTSLKKSPEKSQSVSYVSKIKSIN
ncbi:hypothetical protein [Flavobacterium luteolum]|uniref:hypothetical protein n=1 Tax=Flavobacterium luteolum TaxID=3003259 RepID=UPI00248F2823|nr:hypothetical protein [Flavobacterium luteolum]